MLLGTLHRSMPSSPLSPHLEAPIGRAVLLPRARVGEWGGIHAPPVATRSGENTRIAMPGLEGCPLKASAGADPPEGEGERPPAPMRALWLQRCGCSAVAGRLVAGGWRIDRGAARGPELLPGSPAVAINSYRSVIGPLDSIPGPVGYRSCIYYSCSTST